MNRLPLFLLLATFAAAQQPLPPLQQPWDGVPERYRNIKFGQLRMPDSAAEWKRQRPEVRKIVVNSLGDMPARPSKLLVRTVSVDKKDGFTIEKFVFDNGVDSEVPGYIAIPNERKGRLPAILTMHGHGSSKENMFGYQPTSQDVAEMLTKGGMS